MLQSAKSVVQLRSKRRFEKGREMEGDEPSEAPNENRRSLVPLVERPEPTQPPPSSQSEQDHHESKEGEGDRENRTRREIAPTVPGKTGEDGVARVTFGDDVGPRGESRVKGWGRGRVQDRVGREGDEGCVVVECTLQNDSSAMSETSSVPTARWNEHKPLFAASRTGCRRSSPPRPLQESQGLARQCLIGGTRRERTHDHRLLSRTRRRPPVLDPC